MPEFFRSLGAVIRRAAKLYGDLKVSRIGAALAFYGVFSLGPLLVIAFSIAGWIVGAEAAQGLIAGQIADVVGASTAETVERLLEASDRGGTGVGATIIAGAVLFYIGSTVFLQVQAALAEIFGAASEETSGWRVTLWRRLRGFVAIVTISILLVAMVLANLATASALDALTEFAPWVQGAGRWIAPTISAVVLISLIAAMYRWLTAVRIPWKAARRGAVVTSVLLIIGAWAVGLYFGTLGEQSGAYAAFPLMVLLALFNFLSQALLFGAALTKVYTDTNGVRGRLSSGSSSTQPA